MTEIGYTLSSEEHGPQALVEHAVRAEQVDFSFASISDHFHPWIDKQGESPSVWGVLGAISQATERLQLLTGVTCPTTRIHPAIIAQAAATAAAFLPRRFSLGVGSGENLNEHILDDRWPAVSDRQARLEEAIEVIRLLWSGLMTCNRTVAPTTRSRTRGSTRCPTSCRRSSSRSRVSSRSILPLASGTA